MRQRGFTLVEVLVALVIVSVALAAGLRAAAGATTMSQRLEESLAAQWCAQNQLAAIRLARLVPPVGEAEFTCEQMGLAFRGRTRTQPTPNPNFRRVDAQVLDAQGVPLLSLSTVVTRQ